MKSITEKYSSGSLILKECGEYGSLLLGDCNSALNHNLLKVNNVVAIFSFGLEACPPKEKIKPNIIHKAYDIHDNIKQKISVELFEEINDFIDIYRRKGGVLLHCYAGVSRSATFVISYIMKLYKITFEEAKSKVKKIRPCIHPGDGFIKQLNIYYKFLQNEDPPEETHYQIEEKKIDEFSCEAREIQIKAKKKMKGSVKCAPFILDEIEKIGNEKECVKSEFEHKKYLEKGVIEQNEQEIISKTAITTHEEIKNCIKNVETNSSKMNENVFEKIVKNEKERNEARVKSIYGREEAKKQK